MKLKESALCLAELGNEKRLAIFRYLVKSGNQGTPVGEIQKKLMIPASTLSHHISRLTRVGLISQERNGRVLFCTPRLDKLQHLLDFLIEECCEGKTCVQVSKCCE